MKEQHEIITPVFKSKPSNFKKHAFTARPAVKVQVNDVELKLESTKIDRSSDELWVFRT